MLNIFGHPIIITSGGYDKKAGKNIGVSSTALYQVTYSIDNFEIKIAYFANLFRIFQLFCSN